MLLDAKILVLSICKLSYYKELKQTFIMCEHIYYSNAVEYEFDHIKANKYQRVGMKIFFLENSNQLYYKTSEEMTSVNTVVYILF